MKSRSKQAITVPTLNNDLLKFYMDLQMDSMRQLRNLSDANPTVGQLRVYDDPEFHELEEDQHLQKFLFLGIFNKKLSVNKIVLDIHEAL